MAGACAICGKPAAEKFKPFCSARCAHVDLGRWLGESYKVPAAAIDEDTEDMPSLKQDDREDA
ncbi:MAG: DNA gyrase inhibitor YacG [Alphaproteobacteria bacterium]|nr:DNA gyrase inhibitor YacG [Alphaproteobacteria bacterium]